MRHILDVEEQDWLLREDVANGHHPHHHQLSFYCPRSFWPQNSAPASKCDKYLSAQGLSVLEAEGKVFDCLVRPPTLKHVATIGDDVDEDDDDDDDDDDDKISYFEVCHNHGAG